MIIPLELYPVVVIQDRYDGAYSRGKWLAIVEATQQINGRSRVDWTLIEGPSGGDGDAAEFWSDPPNWIAAAADLNAVLIAVFAKNGYEDPAILSRSAYPPA